MNEKKKIEEKNAANNKSHHTNTIGFTSALRLFNVSDTTSIPIIILFFLNKAVFFSVYLIMFARPPHHTIRARRTYLIIYLFVDCPNSAWEIVHAIQRSESTIHFSSTPSSVPHNWAAMMKNFAFDSKATAIYWFCDNLVALPYLLIHCGTTESDTQLSALREHTGATHPKQWMKIEFQF